MIQIGIIRTSSIGDVVLSTAVIDYLKNIEKICPKKRIEICFITKKPSFHLISASFPEINCVDVESFKSPSELIENIKGLNCLVDLQMNFRSRRISQLFMKKTGNPCYSVKKDRLKRSLMVFTAWLLGRNSWLNHQSSRQIKRQFQAAIEPVIAAVMDAGIDKLKAFELAQIANPCLPITGRDSDKLSEFSNGIWIAIAPGASYLPKRYPIESFTAILQNLVIYLPEKFNLGIVFLGDENDFAAAEKIVSQLSWPWRILNICGKTKLSEIAQILKYCQATLGNDSAIGHISEAVGTPSGVFFGPTTELFGFAPFRNESKSFSVSIGCRPCSRHGSRTCRYGDQKCFADIDQNLVVRWILSRLGLSQETTAEQTTAEQTTAEQTTAEQTTAEQTRSEQNRKEKTRLKNIESQEIATQLEKKTAHREHTDD